MNNSIAELPTFCRDVVKRYICTNTHPWAFRLVKILLHIVAEHTAEENNFIQRVGIFLLNSLACQVKGYMSETSDA